MNNINDINNSMIIKKHENRLKISEDIKYNIKAYKLFIRMRNLYHNSDFTERRDYHEMTNILVRDTILFYLTEKKRLYLIRDLISFIIERVELHLQNKENEINNILKKMANGSEKNKDLLLKKLNNIDNNYSQHIIALKNACTKESLKEKIRSCAFLPCEIDETFSNGIKVYFSEIYSFIEKNMNSFLKMKDNENESK